MRTFKDTEGREWQVAVHAGTVKRVKNLLGVNLCELMEQHAKILVALHDDLVFLVDCVYVVCKPQADERGLSDEQFAAGLGGDVLEQAREALLEEIVDFFPKREVRQSIKKVVTKLRAMAEVVIEQSEKEINQFDEQSAAKKLIDSFGSSPASPASTRKTKRSAN